MNIPRFRFLLALTCAWVLPACGSDTTAPPAPSAAASPTPTPTPASVERSIDPAATSTAITSNLAPHFVINPDPQVTARGRLFVMLPGTLAVPNTYQDIVRTGAARGYHALGLTYPNDEAIAGICANSPDPDCAGRARQEIITGENTSTLVAVDPANAIIGRLRALLQFLVVNSPDEGWDQFLVDGEPDWERIVMAGHSQGGGHAGFFAKLVLLNRVVMFSAPGDTGISADAPAQWTSLTNVTPTDRQFGFTHTQDNLSPLANVLGNWQSIGLGAFGDPVRVDGASAPFGGSHQLTTTAPPNPNPTGPSASPTHGAPVVDAVTPRDAQGRPIFEPVWIHLAFP